MYGTYKWLLSIGGFIVTILIVILWRAFGTKDSRENTMMYIRYVETAIFGRPLDKEYWPEGHRPKLPKFVWKKKKEEDEEDETK